MQIGKLLTPLLGQWDHGICSESGWRRICSWLCSFEMSFIAPCSSLLLCPPSFSCPRICHQAPLVSSLNVQTAGLFSQKSGFCLPPCPTISLQGVGGKKPSMGHLVLLVYLSPGTKSSKAPLSRCHTSWSISPTLTSRN